jgi:hypothetical protein
MKRKSQRKYRMEREGDEAYNRVRNTTKYNTRLVPENEGNASELTFNCAVHDWPYDWKATLCMFL